MSICKLKQKSFSFIIDSKSIHRIRDAWLEFSVSGEATACRKFDIYWKQKIAIFDKFPQNLIIPLQILKFHWFYCGARSAHWNYKYYDAISFGIFLKGAGICVFLSLFVWCLVFGIYPNHPIHTHRNCCKQFILYEFLFWHLFLFIIPQQQDHPPLFHLSMQLRYTQRTFIAKWKWGRMFPFYSMRISRAQTIIITTLLNLFENKKE